MISSARATRGLTYKKVEAQVELHSFRLSVFSPLNLDLALTFRWDARSKGQPRPFPFALVIPMSSAHKLVSLVYLVRLVFLVCLVSLVSLVGLPVRPTRQTK
jgi:hypothetical protein